MFQLFSSFLLLSYSGGLFLSIFSIWFLAGNLKIPTPLETVFDVLKLKEDNMFWQITSTNF